MSIVQLCPYAKDEHCKYERYYGEPLFSKCKNCEIKKKVVFTDRKDFEKVLAENKTDFINKANKEIADRQLT